MGERVEGRGEGTFIRSRRRDLGTDIFEEGNAVVRGWDGWRVENVEAVDGALVVSPTTGMASRAHNAPCRILISSIFNL